METIPHEAKRFHGRKIQFNIHGGCCWGGEGECEGPLKYLVWPGRGWPGPAAYCKLHYETVVRVCGPDHEAVARFRHKPANTSFKKNEELYGDYDPVAGF